MDDPVTAYAQSVLSGEIVSGAPVRGACQRHLDDLERADEMGWTFDIERVHRVHDFFTEVLCHTKPAVFAGKPFDWLPWQWFVTGSLFGWVYSDTGIRRYRRAYIEAGKGCGKSPWAAGIALYGLLADGEAAPEVYVCAHDEIQAGIIMSYIEGMVQMSGELAQVVTSRKAAVHRQEFISKANRGVIRAVGGAGAKGAKGKSGFMPSLILVDEYHEHKDSSVLDLMELGFKARQQPMTIIVTNSGAGTDEAEACWHEHLRAVAIARGEVVEHRQFSFVCALDESDTAPFDTQAVWPKTNPGLPVAPPESEISEQVALARGLPSRLGQCERFYFCKWGGAEDPWISEELIRATMVAELAGGREDCPAYIGLDLSEKRDLTAAAVVWMRDDGALDAELTCWTPGRTLHEREMAEGVPYSKWVREGHLISMEGRRVIDYPDIADWLVDVLDRHDVRALAYDPALMERLVEGLSDRGIRTRRTIQGRGLLCIPHGQSPRAGITYATQTWKKRTRELDGHEKAPMLWMPESIDHTERRIMQATLRVRANPLYVRASNGAVVHTDQSLNRRFDKNKRTANIDPLVALVMAIGCADRYGQVLSRKRVPGYARREQPFQSVELRF